MQTTIPQSLYSAMRFNFLYVDKYTFHSGWFFPEDYIPYCLLRFITRGEAVFKINSEEIAVHKNEIVYIPEGAVMSCWALSDNVEFYSIRFCVTARLNDSDFLGEYFHIPTVTKNVQENVLTYFQEIYQSATSQNPSRLFRIRGNLELIIAYLTQCANAECEGDGSSHDRELPDVHSLEAIRRRNAKTQNINRDPRIQIVVDYLTPHLNEQFTIQSLSEMAQVSQTSFRRLFKAHTGKSPSDYIRELRMTSASIASARTMATRCFCPPESCAGYAPALSSSPTRRSSSLAFASASALSAFLTSTGAMVMLSSTVLCGKRLKC